MASSRRRFLSIVASVAITLGGAWLASQVSTSTTTVVAPARSGAVLSVQLAGLRNASGRVIVLVFDDRDAFEAFDVRRAVGFQEREAVAGSLVISFPNLTAGPYAVAAIHDENGDGDLNMEGEVPTEGYATSGALDAYDMPTFSEAAMAAGAVQLDLYYLR